MNTHKNHVLEIDFLPDEYWYGGIVDQGLRMPLHKDSYLVLDMTDNRLSLDQSAPFLLSSKGRYLRSDKPFRAVFDHGRISCTGFAPIFLSDGHENLKGAYMDACCKYFPPRGELPDEAFFRTPQYNTWIELQQNQTQEGILRYAEGILESGMPPGILMIDDGWSEDYGVWEFHSKKFPDPKKMVQKLHQMGFQVMLWVIPVVSPDSALFREFRKENLLLKHGDGSLCINEWWNGYSAVLDLHTPAAWNRFKAQLDALQANYDIDGFKFDGGDAYFYETKGTQNAFDQTKQNPSEQISQDTPALLPQEYTALYNHFALQYPFNELRAAYDFAGRGLVTRLQDKHHSWDKGGINCLIPNSLLQSLLGYAYHCPDMIGGGDVGSDYTNIDEELIVRYAQVSALMPMMQFSLAPWRVLSEKNMDIVRNTALLHAKYGEYILKYAKEAAATGVPIIRHMAFAYPEEDFENVMDQFMLGDHILVAPVCTPGTYRRSVRLPKGIWQGADGTLYKGACQLVLEAPIEKLLYFLKQ